MGNENVLLTEEVMNYEAPSMEKHQPVKTVQGSGSDDYCYYYYSYSYGKTYYYCYYYYY